MKGYVDKVKIFESMLHFNHGMSTTISRIVVPLPDGTNLVINPGPPDDKEALVAWIDRNHTATKAAQGCPLGVPDDLIAVALAYCEAREGLKRRFEVFQKLVKAGEQNK